MDISNISISHCVRSGKVAGVEVGHNLEGFLSDGHVIVGCFSSSLVNLSQRFIHAPDLLPWTLPCKSGLPSVEQVFHQLRLPNVERFVAQGWHS